MLEDNYTEIAAWIEKLVLNIVKWTSYTSNTDGCITLQSKYELDTALEKIEKTNGDLYS